MKKPRNIHYLPFVLSSVLLFPAANGYAAETTLVSINSAGEDGNGGDSRSPATSISADGRYVAFSTWASNLVALDFNWLPDVFVHDRATGTTIRVSVDSAGGQGHGASQAPSISADGRYVAFASTADNLVGGDTNTASDVFVHDLKTGHTSRVSINPENPGWSLRQGNDDSASPSISADGLFVAFSSAADNLVQQDTNGASDIFVHDRRTGTPTTTRASVDSTGQEGNAPSNQPFVSTDGRYVVFSSVADNLVPGGYQWIVRYFCP